MIMDPLQKFRALIIVSCSKILATTKDKPSEHLGVSNANTPEVLEIGLNGFWCALVLWGSSIERETIHYMKGSRDSFLRAWRSGCRIGIESHEKCAEKEPLYAALGSRVP